MCVRRRRRRHDRHGRRWHDRLCGFPSSALQSPVGRARSRGRVRCRCLGDLGGPLGKVGHSVHPPSSTVAVTRVADRRRLRVPHHCVKAVVTIPPLPRSISSGPNRFARRATLCSKLDGSVHGALFNAGESCSFPSPLSGAAPPSVASVVYVFRRSSLAPVGANDDVIASFQSAYTTPISGPPRDTRAPRLECLACSPDPLRKRRLRSALVSSSAPPSLELELEPVLSPSSCRRRRSDPSRHTGCSCSESVSS